MDRRKTDRRANGAQDPYSFDIQDFLDILLRRKLLIALLAVLAFVPGVLHILNKPDLYRSSAVIMLEEPDYSLTDFEAALGEAQIDESAFETQISILKSPRLIEETLKDIGKEKESETGKITQGQIMGAYGKLQVENSGKSRILNISYKAKDPKESAAMVNAHIQNFIDYRMDTKREQIAVIDNWLNEQVTKLKEDSKKKGQAIQQFRGESGITLGPDAENIIYQQIVELTQQLVPIETKKITLQSKVDALDGNTSALADFSESAVIEQLKAQLSMARQDLKGLSTQYGPNHPERRAAEKRVAQLQAEIGSEIASIRKTIITELDSVTTQEALLNARIDELNKKADEMQDQSITMGSLQGDLEANRKLLASYMDKFQELRTKMDLNHSDIRIINKAEVPALPDGPGKPLMFMVLIAFSVFFGITATLLLEIIDRGIEKESDIKNILNLRLLGSLPNIRNPLSALTAKNRNDYLEEIKRIYLQLANRNGPQVLMVTSAANGEGKTTTALNLARYLSSIKSRVLLIDADTHTPSLSTLSGVDVTPGFAELINGTTDFTKAIKRDETGLPVIPAGDHDRNRVDILSSNAFSQMLETLKTQYDYIILDCASARTSTDAEVIARKADLVILVIQWKKTAKKTLKSVAEVLRQHARDIPHVIINKRR